MTSSKRERELARAKYQRQQARRVSNHQARARRQKVVAGVVVAVLILAGAGWILVARSSSSPTGAAALPTALPPTQATPALSCTAPGAIRSNSLTFSKPGVPSTAAKTITFHTNCGDIVIATDAKAPKTVASEQFLATSGFYNDTKCHRLTTTGIYVLQCGDPKGDGTGGPGYTVPDENLPASGAGNYPAGTVAMANSGPNTNGSQFFLVYRDTTLPGSYTIWGHVTAGLDIVKAIAAQGTLNGANDGEPKQPVFINKASAA